MVLAFNLWLHFFGFFLGELMGKKNSVPLSSIMAFLKKKKSPTTTIFVLLACRFSVRAHFSLFPQFSLVHKF